MKDRDGPSVAHRLSTIVNSDRILVVNNGQIIEDEDHKTLLEKGRASTLSFTICSSNK